VSTKQKILDSALKLFNENGIVNVRLQHIADEAFVSVGNLAYHYKNKEAIVKALYSDLTQKQRELLAEYRVVPLFDNMDRLFRLSFHLQNNYVFFYLDTWEIERAYPSIAEIHRQYINWQIEQLKSMLNFNSSRGALVPEPSDGLFEQLAIQIWMTTDLWKVQQKLRGKGVEEEGEYRTAVWSLLMPYFTKVGMLEYEQMMEGPFDISFDDIEVIYPELDIGDMALGLGRRIGDEIF